MKLVLFIDVAFFPEASLGPTALDDQSGLLPEGNLMRRGSAQGGNLNMVTGVRATRCSHTFPPAERLDLKRDLRLKNHETDPSGHVEESPLRLTFSHHKQRQVGENPIEMGGAEMKRKKQGAGAE